MQVLRRAGNALIDKDMLIGAGSSCQCKGGAFVLTPSGPKGTSSGKTYTFTPVVNATTDLRSDSAETPEAIAKLWAERLNQLKDEVLILRLSEPNVSTVDLRQSVINQGA